jgi:hypothetical protein
MYGASRERLHANKSKRPKIDPSGHRLEQHPDDEERA